MTIKAFRNNTFYKIPFSLFKKKILFKNNSKEISHN